MFYAFVHNSYEENFPSIQAVKVDRQIDRLANQLKFGDLIILLYINRFIL